ncbi:energy transducer TonB [Pseudoduganella sp. LjRoot289]|uniref:energy transducer TonB n=1 Tax=Pseudoduganella sp. LjRoot289 TaxID=3342314 RepID=UPI003ECC7BFA
MYTMTIDGPAARGQGHVAKFAIVAAVHAGLFYMLQAGMLRDVVHAVLPQAVHVSFVAPPAPAPEPAPKIVPVLPQAPAIAPPPLPLLNITVDNTITPQVQPRSEMLPVPVPAAAPPQQQAAAPAPAKPSAPRLVEGVEYLRPPAPVYPILSRRMGESGVVMLRVLISEKGLPEQATVQKSSGSGKLDEAGRLAAMRSLFKPYMEDGKPVAVYVIVPINFQLS